MPRCGAKGTFPKLSRKNICLALLNHHPVQINWASCRPNSPLLFLDVCPDEGSLPFLLISSIARGLKGSRPAHTSMEGLRSRAFRESSWRRRVWSQEAWSAGPPAPRQSTARGRDRTHVSCLAGRFFTAEPPGNPTYTRTASVLSSFPVRPPQSTAQISLC